MSYVFGPVPSRRLGQSLGVDTIPLKTCNWNCVYCQPGRTRPVLEERREYYPRAAILREVGRALQRHEPGEIDRVTFVGSGEPTLHAGLGWLIREVKRLSDLPVAVITNGSLLGDAEVCAELLAADAVLPSLDAGSASLYKHLNRAHPAATFHRHLHGLISFRRAYRGRFWLEVMLVRGLNDTASALRALAEAIDIIQPDEVHLSPPTRPPVESWVAPPTAAGIMRAQAILGKVAHVVHPAAGAYAIPPDADPVEAIVDIIRRHPMRDAEMRETLAHHSDTPQHILTRLHADPRAKLVRRHGTYFWIAADAYFPPAGQSARTAPQR